MNANKDEKISVYIEPDLCMEIRILAVKERKTLSQIASEAFALLRQKKLDEEYAAANDF